ncbi:hypothetical protein AbraIFM66951_002079 [Aspergillus brasiliensis]|uniref:Uncharacterized protein n=1 Tax=Aspergillus brasiliensis TaxID=319629 RepID=A0A9W5YZW0_9EURO|nr:hypothetical protein AbraCBS73388_001781 [Aspergillus brasiliensis]GKZ49510.1 hypothetical protein AbraIFM66951_002079 [Aspergillus brasiliensis]
MYPVNNEEERSSSPEELETPASAAAPAVSIPDSDTNCSNLQHHNDASNRPSDVPSTQPASTGDKQKIPTRGTTAPISLYALLGNDGEGTEDIRASQLPRRQRKYRHTNLRNEVDAALSVLHEELESNETLKRKIEELRNEITNCNQAIRTRDLSIISLRRELDSLRSSAQEMETRRDMADRLDNAKKKIQELQAKNESLCTELGTSTTETAEAQALVRDWKIKLAQLISN